MRRFSVLFLLYILQVVRVVMRNVSQSQRLSTGRVDPRVGSGRVGSGVEVMNFLHNGHKK